VTVATLALRDVSADYGGTHALRDVSLAVPEGRVVALIGPNGAGKTTLLRCCSGLMRPSRGTIVLNGDDVTHLSPHERAARGVCHIPEGRAVFASMTVAENLRLFGATDGIDLVLDTFPALRTKLSRPAGTMSGGEQQMLALARGLMSGAKFFLLDEVSMGLAPRVVAEIFEFLAQLASTGAALLLVEQYVAQALELADLVYVLRKGQVAFAGEPSELDIEALAESYLGVDTPKAPSVTH
jgi:branched-chain amino acid transport system ATP-binding protein